ncbi:ROK family transcriptional regulator [Humibacter sp.]|uniref:ROK family transcriptional regulator n=1 Tax=Humibacter sp. TaxID=1940291 RepID=UPI002CD38DE5|nr:ROK family transcriptional regulator [Humibacter sp.]HVX07553.1 ROK family transcriptional regulator [Humibacter sp.]
MTEALSALPPDAVPVRPPLGSNLDGVRQHNLGAVLRLVHGNSGRSRSELTRATGLSRSTIGALVAELSALGLVSEEEPRESTGVGRPSPIVVANPHVVVVTVNPEVDSVTVGLVGLDGTVHRRVRHATSQPPTAAEAARIVANVLDGFKALFDSGLRATGIGAAVPGSVREADGVVRMAPHLEWVDEPFAALLEEATGLPAVVANDASLGANAEHLFGAGRDIEDLIYLNGGSGGIGGGVIARGMPLAGSFGYAGELGHTLVNSAGARCHCGAIGCLETEVSQARLLEALGIGDPEELDEAAGDLDATGRAEVERQLRFLAIGIRNAVNVLNPRRVVLGGFLGVLLDAAPEVLDAEVRSQSLAASAEHVDIVRAELGGGVLIVGAAELAFSRLIADPTMIQR